MNEVRFDSRFEERWKGVQASLRGVLLIFFFGRPTPVPLLWVQGSSVCAPTHKEPATHQTALATVWLESPISPRGGGTAKPCVVSAELRSLQQRLLPQERASTVPPPYEMRCSRRVSRTRFLLTYDERAPRAQPQRQKHHWQQQSTTAKARPPPHPPVFKLREATATGQRRTKLGARSNRHHPPLMHHRHHHNHHHN